MKIFELLNKGAKVLSENLTDINPRFESELLLSFVLKKERIFLAIHRNDEVDKEISDIYLDYINRRKNGEPVSYITGSKEFMSLDFYVCEGVLIPRPDTETLCTHIIEKFKGSGYRMLDLCTGSGAIAVSLAKYIKDTSVDAVDISDICIETAKKNALQNGVDRFVNVIKADVLDGFKTNEKYDCIVSNPPYIKSEVIPTLMKDVRDFEPLSALDGGNDGLIFYEKISAFAPSLLKENGILSFEVGHDQSDEVKKIMTKNGFKDICFLKDLAGIERVVSGRL